MGSYLDSAGLSQVWGKLKDKIDAAKEVKSLTKAEYDALEEKEQNVIYSVTDGEGDSATTSIWLNGEELNNEQIVYHKNATYAINESISSDINTINGKSFVLYHSNGASVSFNDDDKVRVNEFEYNKYHVISILIIDKNRYKIFNTRFIFKREFSGIVPIGNYFYLNNLHKRTVIASLKHASLTGEQVALSVYLKLSQQVDWNETNSAYDVFIKNKPTLLKEFKSITYNNRSSNDDSVIISQDSYIEIYNWFSEESAPYGLTPFTTTLYVGRHTDNGNTYSTGSNESYCFSISFDRKYKYTYNNASDEVYVSVTQLSGSYTSVQKFTKLRIVWINHQGYSVRLYYTNPTKYDRIKVLAIGEGNVVNNIKVPSYSEGPNPTYFDYDLSTGFRVWENHNLKIDSNKDITDVVYSPESKNALTDKSKSTFYTFTNYRNAISSMEDTGEIVGSGSDQKRIYKHTMTNPIEFEVGDVMIIPYISGYTNGEIYGNRLVKITSITNKENDYVIYGYPLNPVPTEYSENRMPDIKKGPVDVDYVIPVEENITATLKNSIISTTKPSHYWDWWIDDAPTNFYDSSSDYIIEGTNVSKFKKGDIIIIPSLTGSYQHVHSGNLLAEVLYVYNSINNGVANTRIRFHIINYDFNDETGNYVGVSLNNTEIKLYARL